MVALATIFLTQLFWTIGAHKTEDGDITELIQVGTRFIAQGDSPLHLPVTTVQHSGFDGQFYLYLSTDPLLHKSSTIERLDAPFLRARRIGYPIAIYALSLGHVRSAPWVMFLLVSFSVGATCAMVCLTARNEATGPIWAGLLFFSLPMLQSFHYLTSESFALALVMGSVVAWRNHNTLIAAMLAAVAGLTKEVALIWPLACVLMSLFRSNRRAALIMTLAAVPLFGWMAWLHWGKDLLIESSNDLKNLSWPTVGAFWRLSEIYKSRNEIGIISALVHIFMIITFLAVPCFGLWGLLIYRDPEWLALLLFGLLALTTPAQPDWWDWNNYPRQNFLLELFLLLTLIRVTPSFRRWVSILAVLPTLAGLLFLLNAL